MTQPTIQPLSTSPKSDPKNKLLLGRSIFTVRNKLTGKHFTFKIMEKRFKNGKSFWCYVLRGTENTNHDHYAYIGSIHAVYKTFKEQSNTSYPNAKKVFTWFWDNIGTKNFPDSFQLFHCGYCLKCGRLLTTPESIINGIGPICAKKG